MMLKRIIFLLSQTSEHLCSKRLNECKVKNEMLTEREKNVNRDAAKCACVKEGCMSWFGWNMSLIYLLYLLTHQRSTYQFFWSWRGFLPRRLSFHGERIMGAV